LPREIGGQDAHLDLARDEQVAAIASRTASAYALALSSDRTRALTSSTSNGFVR
jgi:hypothetical protein